MPRLSLRHTRHQKRLTLKALAARSGVHWATISQYERGLRKPGHDKALALEAALHCRIDFTQIVTKETQP